MCDGPKIYYRPGHRFDRYGVKIGSDQSAGFIRQHATLAEIEARTRRRTRADKRAIINDGAETDYCTGGVIEADGASWARNRRRSSAPRPIDDGTADTAINRRVRRRSICDITEVDEGASGHAFEIYRVVARTGDRPKISNGPTGG